MPIILTRLLSGSTTGIGKVVVGEPPQRRNKTGIEVTAAMFFDGTGNNRNNTAQRRMAQHNAAHPDAPIYEEDGIQFSGSFANFGLDKKGQLKNNSYAGGYSNVSILERMNKRRRVADKDISLYIEGIATQDDLDDDTPGNAFGVGKTGVKSKVQLGVSRLAEKLGKILEKNRGSYVEKLTIDVFGFSRGATAARHFISLLQAPVPLAAQLGITDAEIKIKFVGVFDTVSSYGVGLGFGSDVEELGLALAAVPQKVVHLVAANEYRKNFSLTDIASSLQAGVGYELALPGVHSDVGGSYGELSDETRTLHDWEYERLVAQGWYREEEIERTPHPVYDPDTGQLLYTTYSAVGRRRGLTWEYQFIPLRVMADCASKLMDLWPLTPGSRFERYALPPAHPLAPVLAAVLGQVAGHGEQGRHALQLPQDSTLAFETAPAAAAAPLPVDAALARLVRNRYLHRSGSIGFQGLTDGWDRKGMGERRQHGQPHRLVFPG